MENLDGRYLVKNFIVSLYQSTRCQIPDLVTDSDSSVDFNLTVTLILSECFSSRPLPPNFRKLLASRVVIWFLDINSKFASVSEVHFGRNSASDWLRRWSYQMIGNFLDENSDSTRHFWLDDLLKITVAWESLTRLHLEFIDNKLLSSNMKYSSQSSIWITVNLSKSIKIINRYYRYAVVVFPSCQFSHQSTVPDPDRSCPLSSRTCPWKPKPGPISDLEDFRVIWTLPQNELRKCQ